MANLPFSYNVANDPLFCNAQTLIYIDILYLSIYINYCERISTKICFLGHLISIPFTKIQFNCIPVYCVSWFYLSIALKRLKVVVIVSVWQVSHYWCTTNNVMLNMLELFLFLGFLPFGILLQQGKASVVNTMHSGIKRTAEYVNTIPYTVP